MGNREEYEETYRYALAVVAAVKARRTFMPNQLAQDPTLVHWLARMAFDVVRLRDLSMALRYQLTEVCGRAVPSTETVQ